jgi:flagellar protein FliS
MNPPTETGKSRTARTNADHYLEATVRTASPARLRLMLIERAVEVSQALASRWRAGEHLGSNEWSLKLLDLLTELLAGIREGSTESERQVCSRVADLYVFLTQHLVRAEACNDADAIDEIRAILETEAGTWRSVCAQDLSRQPVFGEPNGPAAAGINLQG